jgi:hypothetical protein
MRPLIIVLSFCACSAQDIKNGSGIVHQASYRENSPNISNVSGNVNITYSVSGSCTMESSTHFGGYYGSSSYGIQFLERAINSTKGPDDHSFGSSLSATIFGLSYPTYPVTIPDSGIFQLSGTNVAGADNTIVGSDWLAKLGANTVSILGSSDSSLSSVAGEHSLFRFGDSVIGLAQTPKSLGEILTLSVSANISFGGANLHPLFGVQDHDALQVSGSISGVFDARVQLGTPESLFGIVSQPPSASTVKVYDTFPFFSPLVGLATSAAGSQSLSTSANSGAPITTSPALTPFLLSDHGLLQLADATVGTGVFTMGGLSVIGSDSDTTAHVLSRVVLKEHDFPLTFDSILMAMSPASRPQLQTKGNVLDFKTGTDVTSLAKAVSDLGADRHTITSWTLTYHSETR